MSVPRIILIDGIYLDRSLVEAVCPATAVSADAASIIMRSGAVLLAQGRPRDIARQVWGDGDATATTLAKMFWEEP